MYKYLNTFETDLSDHHKLMSTISNSGSFKVTPWIKVYRSYKSFNIDKTFWKTVRPYFSDKGRKSSKITLVENNIIIADEKRVSELINKHFINITKNLNLIAPIIDTTDDIQSLTKNYENHISIRKIKEAYPEIVPVSILNKCLWMTLKKKS